MHMISLIFNHNLFFKSNVHFSSRYYVKRIKKIVNYHTETVFWKNPIPSKMYVIEIITKDPKKITTTQLHHSFL